jgi:hypothetical protein
MRKAAAPAKVRPLSRQAPAPSAAVRLSATAPADGVAAATKTTVASYNPLNDLQFELNKMRTAVNNWGRLQRIWLTTGENSIRTLLHLPNIPVPGLPPVQKQTPTSRLWDNLMKMTDSDHDDDGIKVKRVIGADGQTRLVVYIGGTVPKLGTTNQPVLDNQIGFAGLTKPEQFADVLTALNLEVDMPIMLVGYSQGGMDAQNLAKTLSEYDYNVKGVVVFGSPLVQDTPTSYPIAYLRDRLDPFGQLERGGIDIDFSKVFTNTSSSDRDPGLGNISVHTNDKTYNEIARKFDVYAGGFSAIKQVIRDFDPANAPGSDTTPPTQPILRFNGVFADRISLYPQGGTDNVGIVGYYIYRDGIRIGPRIDPGGKYIDSTLIPGVGYVFYTTAVDLAGNESIGSAAIKADPARGT